MLDLTAPIKSLQAAICEQTAEACCKAFGQRLDAILLTGSVARGEATCIEERQGVRVLGDAEFFLVFRPHAPLPPKVDLALLMDQIKGRLSGQKIWCDLELVPVHPEYFRRLRPAIFAYELQTCGRVAWGDSSVLSLIPSFSVADIPREDAWRLLLNRMIECLEAAPGVLQTEARATERFLYRLTKLYLDMATSFLVFVGNYQPTYGARDQALRQMAERIKGAEQFPFPLQAFSSQVTACTKFKLRGGKEFPFASAGRVNEANRPAWQHVIEHANRLWRWELTQLTQAPITFTDRELMERWMLRQPLRRRLRGWLVVLRVCGWHRSWRNWPRWIRLAYRGSPRYWVYALASELFFSLPDVLAPLFPAIGTSLREAFSEQPRRTPSAHDLKPGVRFSQRRNSSVLPMVFENCGRADFPEWAKLATCIAINYHRFLEHTRS